MTPKLKNTASIEQNKYYKDCGWPIIFACCNPEIKVYLEQELVVYKNAKYFVV